VNQARPLDGLLVVALEQAVAAPFATRQLADLGARVIKVERRDGGDFARDYDRTVHGQASYFVWLNRGKESIALDLTVDADKEAMDRLLARADVFVHNLKPGSIDRLGFGAEVLRVRFPGLVNCSISGYGPGGPMSARKAYDLLVQCEAGLLAVTGTPDEPAKVGISIADIASGMYAFSGVLTALLQRGRTGLGSDLHVSMLDAMTEWMSQPFYYTAYGHVDPRRTGARHASIAPYGPYRCGDGSTVFIGVQNDREWVRLCHELLARPDLATDPRFAHNPERVARDVELVGILEEALAGTDADTALATLDRIGIAGATMRSPADLREHPQLVARERWRVVDTPAGPVDAVLPPTSSTGWTARMGTVPALGQHTGAVLSELGLEREAELG
jgi:itaconate CoA-transferase